MPLPCVISPPTVVFLQTSPAHSTAEDNVLRPWVQFQSLADGRLAGPKLVLGRVPIRLLYSKTFSSYVQVLALDIHCIFGTVHVPERRRSQACQRPRT